MGRPSILGTALWSLSWVPVAITVNQTLGQITWIQGRSMQPSLNPDSSLGRRDLVAVQMYGLHNSNSFKVGDVVLLRSPTDPERILIKRVLGTSGSVVAPRELSTYPKDKVQIPPSHLWVEGDNVHSIDSNEFGPVSTGLVIGKARWILWPLSRWGPVPARGDLELEDVV